MFHIFYGVPCCVAYVLLRYVYSMCVCILVVVDMYFHVGSVLVIED